MNYKGTIIEESLADKTILERAHILSTKVERVVKEHQTPWLSQWTLHAVEILDEYAQEYAREISHALDYSHGSAWYADFKNDTHHYIIFQNKVFFIDRTSASQYDEAKQYGLSLGIPEHQVDFHPEVKEWKR
ncbi:hypothetical protein HY625_02570 [Candidatus Uhrbacteria bacterium]|nr:hypothetical protein [Candidatus Uhrbacteria bacterium]